MEKTELKIEISRLQAEFLKKYTEQTGISASQLISQYIDQLKLLETIPIHPDVQKYTGIIPDEINMKEYHYLHLLEKHK